MAFPISYPVSARDPNIGSSWADIGVSGWYGVWYGKSDIIFYLSYIYFFKGSTI